MDFSLMSNADYYSIGLTVASCMWFGMADLHIENLMYGFTSEGKFVCTPIDIEVVFDEVVLPSQTHLLRTNNLNIDKFGLVHMFKDLKSNNNDSAISQVLLGFADALEFYNTYSDSIDECLLSLNDLESAPIRMILKPTYKYINAIEESNFEPFFAEEVDQLLRGDVPYFFRCMDNDNLYFYSERDKAEVAKIKWKEITLLTTYDFKAKKFNRSADEVCLKTSLLQLVRSLDIGKDFSSQSRCGMTVIYSGDYCYLKYRRMKLKCKRLSQYISSSYSVA